MEAADTALCRFFALIARSAWRIAVFRPDEQGAFLVVVQHSSSVEISPEYPPERDEKADDGGGNRNAATQIHHLALNALGIHVEYVKRASVIVSAGSPVSFVFRGLQSPFLTEVEVAWLRCKVARGTAAAARAVPFLDRGRSGMASMQGGAGYGCCRPLRRGQAVQISFLACRCQQHIGHRPETKFLPPVPSGQQVGGWVRPGRNNDHGPSSVLIWGGSCRSQHFAVEFGAPGLRAMPISRLS